jgi:hypothetical protein
VHYNYFEDKPQLTMGDTQIKYMYVYAVIFTTIRKKNTMDQQKEKFA